MPAPKDPIKCEQWKENIRQTLKDRGIKPPIKFGPKHSKETREKIRVAQLGNKSHNWIDGRSKDPSYRSFLRRIRVLRIKDNGEIYSVGEWLELKEEYNYTCPCCNKSEPEIRLQPDHIVPVAKNGKNTIDNIQPLCGKCNRKKHIKIIRY